MPVLATKFTRFLCQGFTGNQGTYPSKQAIARGGEMVCGVTRVVRP